VKDPRKTLAARVRTLDRLRRAYTTWQGREQAQLDASKITEAKALKPKAKGVDLTKAHKIIGLPRAAELVDERWAQIKPAFDRWNDATRKAEERVVEAAKLAPFQPGPVEATVHWYYGGSYSSQGYASATYLRRRAELDVEELRLGGIEAVVRDVSMESGGLEVVVKCQDPALDVPIAKACKPMAVRDVVKWCWGHQVNPRVYFPFLPPGYEEKVGLDYFGGEKKAVRT